MKDLLSKLSSYNIFNYLFPGIVFVILAENLSRHSFVHENIFIGVFLYYFIGLVISRLGSLVVEPILRKISFLNFADYHDFVNAAKKDEKLELLLEGNNTYRTLCALFVSILVLRLYELIEGRFPIFREWSPVLLVVFLLFIFLFSYRKQTTYITKRLEVNR